VLDAMKAARQLRTVDLDDHAVIWGHSQGGHAALWAGGLQPEYAPDVPLDGVVAYAPASDLPGLVSALDEVSIGPIFAAFTFASYSAIYDDVELRRVVTDPARGFIGPLSQRCLTDPATIASVMSSLAIADDVSVLRPGATDGAFGARLDENIPGLSIQAPLFAGQGTADPLVRPDAQAGYVAGRCADGQELVYREYAGADHLGVTTDPAAVADLLAFTEARFAGEPWASGCDDLR
jgi:pimeloyl-ACP methyl ester carboxylesterase